MVTNTSKRDTDVACKAQYKQSMSCCAAAKLQGVVAVSTAGAFPKVQITK